MDSIDIRSYNDLVEAFRRRRDELDISYETLEQVAGLQPGYAAKLLVHPPMRRVGPLSLSLLLGGLGLRLTVSEDPGALERVRRRLEPRRRTVEPTELVGEPQPEPAWPRGVDFPSKALIQQNAELRRENKRLWRELDALRASQIKPLPPKPRKKPKRQSIKARHKARRLAPPRQCRDVSSDSFGAAVGLTR
jgi:hypothetical protein